MMLWRSVWRIESTGVLTEVLLTIVAVIFSALGIRYLPPIAMLLIGVCMFLLIYRLRYKRL